MDPKYWPTFLGHTDRNSKSGVKGSLPPCFFGATGETRYSPRCRFVVLIDSGPWPRGCRALGTRGMRSRGKKSCEWGGVAHAACDDFKRSVLLIPGDHLRRSWRRWLWI